MQHKSRIRQGKNRSREGVRDTLFLIIHPGSSLICSPSPVGAERRNGRESESEREGGREEQGGREGGRERDKVRMRTRRADTLKKGYSTEGWG